MTIGEALARAGVREGTLSADEAHSLDEHGYVLLRGVTAGPVLESLRVQFEDCVLPRDKWPFPREAGMRHAFLDNDAQTRSFCLSPRLLAAVAHLIAGRFFLAAIQGRDPLKGGGQQPLHRDWPEGEPGMVQMLAYLDDFGPANGGTRLVPGTQHEAGEMSGYGRFVQHPREIVVEGKAGDVLVLHGRLVHSGMRNESGLTRRSLLICFRDHATYGSPPDTREMADAPPLERYLLGAD